MRYNPTMSRVARNRKVTALRVFVGLLGLVALMTGASTVVFGVRSIVGVEVVTPTIDSEMRFFAVWYAGVGVLLLRAAPRAESEATTIRAVAALLFLAGCSRALSWAVVGRPHTLSLVLMVIELTIPVIVVPWQTYVARPGPKDGAELSA